MSDFYYYEALDAGIDFTTTRYGYRGAGFTYGADVYYWMSQVIYGDNTIFADPARLATNPVDFWLSGLMKWMIPMNGLPAPHNIMLGQWEPSEDELAVGLTQGFGAVSALFWGATECGTTKNPKANTRTAIYEGIMASLAAEDGSWTAQETIYDWEANGCDGVRRGDFPLGDYNFPQFITSTVGGNWNTDTINTDNASEDGIMSSGSYGGDNLNNCWFVSNPENVWAAASGSEMWIMWQKDAYRNCLLAHPRFQARGMHATWAPADGEDIFPSRLEDDDGTIYSCVSSDNVAWETHEPASGAE